MSTNGRYHGDKSGALRVWPIYLACLVLSVGCQQQSCNKASSLKGLRYVESWEVVNYLVGELRHGASVEQGVIVIRLNGDEKTTRDELEKRAKRALQKIDCADFPFRVQSIEEAVKSHEQSIESSRKNKEEKIRHETEYWDRRIREYQERIELLKTEGKG